MYQPILYYSVSPQSLFASLPRVPVMVSAAGYLSRRGAKTVLKQPRLPAQITVRAADSGGYATMTRWHGVYPFTPRQYVTWLIGWRPQWAALMDVGCLDLATRPSLDSLLIQERQFWTTRMAWRMWQTYRELPWAWVPTLHGSLPEQYAAHALAMKPLIEEMLAYYQEAANWDEPEEERFTQFRVGLGSLVPRSPAFVLETLEAIQCVLGRLLVRYHLWGKKLALLQYQSILPGVLSLDTAAWNNLYGREHAQRRKSGLSERAYSWQVSQPVYARKVALALAKPQRLPLFAADPQTLYGATNKKPNLQAFSAIHPDDDMP